MLSQVQHSIGFKITAAAHCSLRQRHAIQINYILRGWKTRFGALEDYETRAKHTHEKRLRRKTKSPRCDCIYCKMLIYERARNIKSNSLMKVSSMKSLYERFRWAPLLASMWVCAEWRGSQMCELTAYTINNEEMDEKMIATILVWAPA